MFSLYLLYDLALNGILTAFFVNHFLNEAPSNPKYFLILLAEQILSSYLNPFSYSF
jgi:hypothetical protein